MLEAFRGAGRLVPATLIALVLAGCGDAALKETDFGSISEMVTSVSTVDGTVGGALVTGDRPAGDASGPTIAVTGVPTAINGGSLRATVSSATPFTRVIVSMQYHSDYYELTFPAPVTSADIVMVLSQNAPQASVAFFYGAAAPGGPFGNMLTQQVNMIRVGSGDVQVSVAWDAPTDVDLHVFDPSGEEIYFGNKTSASGGTLNLDSNPACSIDGVNNENVTWPTGNAPAGQYTVTLVYWSACSQPQSNYTVTIFVRGQQPQIFSGTLVNASTNTQIPIGTFTR